MHKELEPLAGIDIPKLADYWSWVVKTFNSGYQSEVESYLSQSTDPADLEHRMKTLRNRGVV
jgi:hypothetical protein